MCKIYHNGIWRSHQFDQNATTDFLLGTKLSWTTYGLERTLLYPQYISDFFPGIIGHKVWAQQRNLAHMEVILQMGGDPWSMAGPTMAPTKFSGWSVSLNHMLFPQMIWKWIGINDSADR